MIVVTALVTMTDLVAALAMTATMGLAMAVMMTMLAAVLVATVRGSTRRKAVVAIIVAKEAGQILRRRRRSAGCRQELLEKAVGARRKKVRLHMSRLQGVVACVGELWLWGSFRSGRAFAQAAHGTDFLCSDKGVQNNARGRLSGLGK